MRKVLLPAALAAAVALAGGTAARAADQDHFNVTLQGWYPSLSGEIEGNGYSLDVEDDLEADSEDIHYGLDFTGRFGRHHFLFNYSKGSQDGDRLSSEIELSRGHAFYGWSVVNMKYFDFGPIGGADWYDLTTKASGGEAAQDAMSFSAGLDAGFRIPVFPMAIRAEATTSLADLSGDETDVTEASLFIDFHIVVVNLQIGYRYYDLETENDDGDKASYKFEGPFAGIGFRF